MSAERASFGQYRAAIDQLPAQQHGIEFMGLSRLEFEAATVDDRTIFANGYPVITSAEHSPWYNSDFFSVEKSRLFVGGPLLGQRAITNALDIDALAGLSEGDSMIALPVLSTDTIGASALCAALQSRGILLKDRLEKRAGASHYNYVSNVLVSEPSVVDSEFCLVEAMVEFEAKNKNSDSRTSFVLLVDDEDIAVIWAYYSRIFGKLSEDDPIIAGYDEAGLQALMRNEQIVKMVFRGKDNAPVAVGFLCDIRSAADVFNGQYFTSRYEPQYETGLVHVSPGLVRDESYKFAGSAGLEIFKKLRSFYVHYGIEPVVSFFCNEQSKQTVPRIVQKAMNGSGMALDIALPVSELRYRGYEIIT